MVEQNIKVTEIKKLNKPTLVEVPVGSAITNAWGVEGQMCVFDDKNVPAYRLGVKINGKWHVVNLTTI